MAQILPFNGARKDRTLQARIASADIVIFPGVRVEYHDQPPKPAGEGTLAGKGRHGGARRGRSPKSVRSA